MAHALLDDEEARARLTADIYVPPPDEPGLGSIDAALASARASLAVEKKIRAAVRKGVLDRAPGDMLADRAVEAGVITKEERETIRAADEIRDEVIRVDAFERTVYGALRR